MGKGYGTLTPMLAPATKIAGEMSPTVKLGIKEVKKGTGLDLTKSDLGEKEKQKQAQSTNVRGNDGISSRTVATGTPGSIEKVYDKKDAKK